jgi:uncharacterized protein YecE (DUF72 family)
MSTRSTRSPAARKSTRRSPISIGIGSWADPEYTGVLFPKGVKSEERLAIYATHFGHVEVNASFYRTPQRKNTAEWASQTPADFQFDVKLHRAFCDTPEKTAGDADFVSRWRDCLQPLVDAHKLGALLVVMTPAFAPGKRRLEELDGLVAGFAPCRIAVELRHNGWVGADVRERTLGFFRERKLVWVAVDMPRIESSTIMPPVDEVTNPQLAYLRLHGRNKNWFKVKSAELRHAYQYDEDELGEIAQRVRRLQAQAETVHVVANNHAADFAPKTALALQRLLGLSPRNG